jgi:hypothetical protein
VLPEGILPALLRLIGLLLAGYPLAAALRLPWIPRLITASTLGLVSSAALAWGVGVLLPAVRPDLPVWMLALLGGALLIRDLRRSRPLHLKPSPGQTLAAGVAIGVAALQCALVANSGWRGGSLYLATHHSHDASWHLAIAAMLRPGTEFATPWPPPNPVWADQPLSNYHPLSDVIVALLAPHEEHVNVYFRVLPPLYALLIAGAAAWTAREWGGSAAICALTVALVGLCGGLGHLVALVGGYRPYWSSVFWLGQTFGVLINPPMALSLAALFTGLALLSRRESPPLATAAAVGVLWGLSFGLKAYLSVLAAAALALAALLASPADRRRLVLAFGVVMLGAVLMMVLTTRGAAGTFFFQPKWLLWTLLISPERVGLRVDGVRQWPLPLQLPALALLALFALACYVVGNLGVRVFGLPGAWRALRGKNGPPDTQAAQRVGAAIAGIGLVIPLLLAQRGAMWNSIQFADFALPLLPLWAAPQIVRWVASLPAPGRAAGVAALLAFALPTTLHTLWMNRWGNVIPPEEITALRDLKGRVPAGGRILVSPAPVPARAALPRDRFVPPTPSTETAYVAALTARPTYYADPLTLGNLGFPEAQRREEILQALRLPPPLLEQWLAERRIAAVYTAPPGPNAPAAGRSASDGSIR